MQYSKSIAARPVVSQDDEVALLKAIASAIPAGTFLSSLFTKDMVGYLTQQIKADFQCDLFGDLQHAANEGIKARNEAWAARNLNERNCAELRAMIEKLQFERQVERSSFEKHILSMQQCIERMQGEINTLENNDSMRRNVVANAQSEIEALRQTIVELKARLYDLLASK